MQGYEEVIKQLGIGAGFFAITWLLIRWAVNQWDRMSQDATAERKVWLEEILKMNKDRIRAEERSDSHATRVNEAHSFQRQEHIKMIENLSEINFSLRSINGGSSERK